MMRAEVVPKKVGENSTHHLDNTHADVSKVAAMSGAFPCHGMAVQPDNRPCCYCCRNTNACFAPSKPAVKASSGTDNEPPRQDSLLVDVEEACRLLGGIGRTSLWRLEKRGLINQVKIEMKRALYSRKQLEKYVSGQVAVAAKRSWRP
ncbi:helix-turn-helix transcriptional regulator [Ereboglobus luteus]|uniref:helix-turn-helix transcriptional regulator n=1 Tax=Ereboglobus luteus TaxID=1796921 RepID=UPI00126034D2|nr:helix-turn-helix domain-containing protein [Ereboglobus luteus]